MIDFRSDTVTKPTDKMRDAMFHAMVGDDVYGDDPTVNELEAFAAELVGKEASLFVPSGTFGNQVALLTHCNRGDEVIVADDCHIVQHEVGAASVIAGVQLRMLDAKYGILNKDEIRSKIRGTDIHFPKTSLICVENAHSSGTVIPIDVMKDIYNLASEHAIPVHLDGARLFNAATYLQIEAKDVTKYCDTVMFCLSKGLCAPVGSILAGSKSFIDIARKNRKLMGGGLRQAGVLAATGLIALKEMVGRLKDDHSNAKYLGKKFSEIEDVNVMKDDIHINMVFFKINKKQVDYDGLVDYFYAKGIKINGPENEIMRFVTNNDVTRDDIDFAASCLKEYLK